MDEINIRDAKMMYQTSLVLRKGVPTFIRSVRDDGFVYAWNLVSQKFIRFRFNPKDLSPPSIRLGYVNIGTNCFYLSRTPARVYKVGLTSENLRLINTDHPLNEMEHKEASNTIMYLSSVNLYKTIKGVFPKINVAFSQATENKGCVAFDRQFAVDYGCRVFYKGKKVGLWNTKQIVFDETYSYLVNNLPKEMRNEAK